MVTLSGKKCHFGRTPPSIFAVAFCVYCGVLLVLLFFHLTVGFFFCTWSYALWYMRFVSAHYFVGLLCFRPYLFYSCKFRVIFVWGAGLFWLVDCDISCIEWFQWVLRVTSRVFAIFLSALCRFCLGRAVPPKVRRFQVSRTA